MFRRMKVLGFLTVLLFAAVPVAPAHAAQVRLHVFQFNICDQYESGSASQICAEYPGSLRSASIADSVRDFDARAVIIQEICRVTFNDLLYVQLGTSQGWYGVFVPTFVVPIGERRCQPAGGSDWGIAILARGSESSSVDGAIIGYDPRSSGGQVVNGEPRRLLCGNMSINTIGYRLCSTHTSYLSDPDEDPLSPQRDSRQRAQFAEIKDRVDNYTSTNAAVLLGGDFNRDVQNCYPPYITPFDQFYRGLYGDGGSLCRTGFGPFYETDHFISGGDGSYDESTSGFRKFDYVFMNHSRFGGSNYGGDATSSIYSDHDPLRGAMTMYS